MPDAYLNIVIKLSPVYKVHVLFYSDWIGTAPPYLELPHTHTQELSLCIYARCTLYGLEIWNQDYKYHTYDWTLLS